MKRQNRIAHNTSATAQAGRHDESQEYRVRVIATSGAVLTEIDDLAWDAIRPYVREYDGQFARIEIRPAADPEGPE